MHSVANRRALRGNEGPAERVLLARQITEAGSKFPAIIISASGRYGTLYANVAHQWQPYRTIVASIV
jgi:hypothetical protein